MGLREDMASAMEALFGTGVFGIAATYNGAAVEIIMEIGDNAETGPRNKMAEEATAYIRTDDVAAPAYRDVVVAEGKTWTVASVIESGPGCHLVQLESNRRHTP